MGTSFLFQGSFCKGPLPEATPTESDRRIVPGLWSDLVGFRRISSDFVGFRRILSDLVGFGRILLDLVGFGRILSDSVRFGQIGRIRSE